MGVLGMHVVLCFRQFGVLGPWLILIWFLLNLTAGIIGGYHTTYMAHAGGFMAGIFLASILVLLKVAKYDDTGLSLLKILRPSLYKAGLYTKPELPREAVLIARRRADIATYDSFKVDVDKSRKQVQLERKRPYRAKCPNLQS
jgi:hypothetical protein